MNCTQICENNRRKYTIPGGASYQYRPKNSVMISSANSIRHELGKTLAAYMLRKWGDVNWCDSINSLLKMLEDATNECMKGFPKQKAEFITECCPKPSVIKEKNLKTINRRIDLVDLNNELHKIQ